MQRRSAVRAAAQRGADHQLLCILGDVEWPGDAVRVDMVVQGYLLAVQAARLQRDVAALAGWIRCARCARAGMAPPCCCVTGVTTATMYI
jgi:hypothetical protein